MKEGIQIALKDGHEIMLDDEKDLISIKLNGTTVFTMTYPAAGYGGVKMRRI